MDLKKKETKWPVRVSFVKEIYIFDKEAEERNGEFKLKTNKQKPKQSTNKLKTVYS